MDSAVYADGVSMKGSPDGKQPTEAQRISGRDSLVYRMLQHPLRHKILIRTGERPWSPTEIAEDTGEPLKRVCEQVGELLKQSPPLLELVEERPGPKGGSPRHYYRALVRVNVTVDEWERLPPIEQAWQTITITEELVREWINSINCGAFYRDSHHVLMRTALTVDAIGMQRINSLFCDVGEQLPEVERESAERRSVSGSPGIRLITGLLSFRAAPE
jgi:hypothetical protein